LGSSVLGIVTTSELFPLNAFEPNTAMNSVLLQDVAVKILMEQDYHLDRFREFMREVC
jgi:1,2-phenylacetyl-CoA epoxidase catalytic subunit